MSTTKQRMTWQSMLLPLAVQERVDLLFFKWLSPCKVSYFVESGQSWFTLELRAIFRDQVCPHSQRDHSLGFFPRSWDFKAYLGNLGIFTQNAHNLGIFH